MGTQKFANLLNGSDYENSKFATTKKWDILDSEAKGNYSINHSIKCLISSLESSLCNYSDSYILVTGNITVTRTIAAAAAAAAEGDDPQKNQVLNAATQVVFKNCALFKNCRTEINDTFVYYADFINITIPMYNLIQ